MGREAHIGEAYMIFPNRSSLRRHLPNPAATAAALVPAASALSRVRVPCSLFRACARALTHAGVDPFKSAKAASPILRTNEVSGNVRLRKSDGPFGPFPTAAPRQHVRLSDVCMDDA